MTKIDCNQIVNDTLVCCQGFGKTLITIFYWLYILIGLPLLALGKSVVNFEALSFINIIVIYLLFCVFLPPCYKKFWIWPNLPEENQYCFNYHMFCDENNTWRTILKMLKIISGQAFIITFAHFVGYVGLTFVFDKDVELFTWITSLMGAVYIFLTGIMLSLAAMCCVVFYICYQDCCWSIGERYFKQDSQVVVQEVVV